MKNKLSFLSLSFSVVFVILLTLPALGYFFHFAPGHKLFGYVEITTARPEKLVNGWFNKTLQPHLEEVINQDLGFRAIIIRLFNDLNFRLFSEHPRSDIYSTKEHGLYFKYSIAHLNDEYINREKLTQSYNELASKLVEIQHLLAAKGKRFEVIISASKPYIHLDGLSKRFLVNTDKGIYSKVASLGRVLKARGVNVIDSGPLLRTFYKKNAIETHAYSGVHWNYYAGCLIAKQLFNDMRQTYINTPILHCNNPSYRRAELIDRDGHLLINVMSRVGIIKSNPYPTPHATYFAGYLPQILFVGDSFMHQVISSLDQAKSYSKMTISSYFRTNIKHKPGELLIYDDPNPAQQIEEGILKAAMENDVVILQMVDYNISRMGYGFVEALLKQLKEENNNTST